MPERSLFGMQQGVITINAGQEMSHPSGQQAQINATTRWLSEFDTWRAAMSCRAAPYHGDTR